MRASPFLMLVLTGLTLFGQVSPIHSFRQWMGGQEVGGSTLETRLDGKVREVRCVEGRPVNAGETLIVIEG